MNTTPDMKRHLTLTLKLCFLLASLLLPCPGQAADKASLAAANPFLIGKWTGEGRFLDIAINKEIGTVPLEVEIKNDNTVSGRISDAKLTKTSIEKPRYGFEIHGVLDSKIKKDKAEKKDHLIILLVAPVKDKEGVLVSEANFHLKSNYTLDLNMHVGGVMLKKQP